MLNAKEARIKTKENKISNAMADIEKQIKKAIAKGARLHYFGGSY